MISSQLDLWIISSLPSLTALGCPYFPNYRIPCSSSSNNILSSALRFVSQWSFRKQGKNRVRFLVFERKKYSFIRVLSGLEKIRWIFTSVFRFRFPTRSFHFTSRFWDKCFRKTFLAVKRLDCYEGSGPRKSSFRSGELREEIAMAENQNDSVSLQVLPDSSAPKIEKKPWTENIMSTSANQDVSNLPIVTSSLVENPLSAGDTANDTQVSRTLIYLLRTELMRTTLLTQICQTETSV